MRTSCHLRRSPVFSRRWYVISLSQTITDCAYSVLVTSLLPSPIPSPSPNARRKSLMMSLRRLRGWHKSSVCGRRWYVISLYQTITDYAYSVVIASLLPSPSPSSSSSPSPSPSPNARRKSLMMSPRRSRGWRRSSVCGRRWYVAG
jgi:hypothetical protein